MSYKVMFMAFCGFLFVCSLFGKDVVAQGIDYGRPTPIPAPPPTVVFSAGNDYESFIPVMDLVCWSKRDNNIPEETIRHPLRGFIGSDWSQTGPNGGGPFMLKFVKVSPGIPLLGRGIDCEINHNAIGFENRFAYFYNGFFCNSYNPVFFWDCFSEDYNHYTDEFELIGKRWQLYIEVLPNGFRSVTVTPTIVNNQTSSPTPIPQATSSATLTSTPTQTLTPTPTATRTVTPTFTQTATSTETLSPSLTSTSSPSSTPSLTPTSTSTIEPSQTPVPTRRPRPPVRTSVPVFSPTEIIIPTVEAIVFPTVLLSQPTVETLNMATVEAIIATRVSGFSEVDITPTKTSSLIPTLTMTLLPTQTPNSEVDLNSPEILKNEFGKEINYYKPVKGDICFGKLVNGKKNVIAEFTSNYFRQVKFEDAKCYDGSKISLVQLFVHLASKGESYEIAVFPAMDIYTSPSSTP